MSRLPTITDEQWLHNPHAGEMLTSEFMEPMQLAAADLAVALRVSADSLQEVLDGKRRLNGDLDLRLARYFGMSEGFFLRLQDSYELMEAKRALNGALDRIVPRAA